MSRHPTAEALSNSFLESHLCDSPKEAVAIADAIIQEITEESSGESDDLFQKRLVNPLQEYFSLTPEEARDILRRAVDTADDDENDQNSMSSGEEETGVAGVDEEDEVSRKDDGEYIGEGECELCERFVQLTRHHLIPKSTHARVKTKLLHAATAIEQGDRDRARRILGNGLEHVVESLNDTSKWNIRNVLQQTCDICRTCHSAVHRTHDNMTLALNYNTVEQLLEDERIYKFCQWASKQKPGKYAVKR